ncbi:MAG TPA: hypothetical protein VGE69_10270, partial [Pseudomonadales bacterium]
MRSIASRMMLQAILALCCAAPALSAAAAEADTRWHVVLAAVGNEQNVFDNFVSDFASTLKGAGNVVSVTELHASAGENWKPSGMRALEASLSALKPQ